MSNTGNAVNPNPPQNQFNGYTQENTTYGGSNLPPGWTVVTDEAAKYAGVIGDIYGAHRSSESAEHINEETMAFNKREAEKARKFNAAQAELNRQWQHAESSTAYQRATADMKAAGINPMLAYMQGGAQTGGGSSASGQAASVSGLDNPGKYWQHALSSAVHSGMDFKKKMQETALMKQSEQKQKEEVEYTKAATSKTIQDEHQSRSQTMKNVEEANLAKTSNELRSIEKKIAEMSVPTARKYNEYQQKMLDMDKDWQKLIWTMDRVMGPLLNSAGKGANIYHLFK